MEYDASPFEFPDNLEPGRALSKFLFAVRRFLGQLVQSNESPRYEPLFDPDLLPDMRAAWKEVSQYVVVLEEAALSVSNTMIFTHGLYGPQWRFKLNVVRYCHSLYVSRGRRVLRKLLEAIDNLLESIEAALPGSTLVSEFKKALEIAILGED
jgi:hypothetical protein